MERKCCCCTLDPSQHKSRQRRQYSRANPNPRTWCKRQRCNWFQMRYTIRGWDWLHSRIARDRRNLRTPQHYKCRLRAPHRQRPPLCKSRRHNIHSLCSRCHCSRKCRDCRRLIPQRHLVPRIRPAPSRCLQVPRFELFSGGAPAGLTASVAGAFVLGAALVPVVLPLARRRWLVPTSYLAMPYLALALLLVLPLSFATIHVVPALNGSSDEIHAIKMGYPVFWTALLVPAALRLGKKRAPPVL